MHCFDCVHRIDSKSEQAGSLSIVTNFGVYLRSSIPGSWFVCCVGYKKTYLWGSVPFASFLRSSVDSSRVSVICLLFLWLLVLVLDLVIVGCFRKCLLCPQFVFFILQLTALVVVMFWFFTEMACWLRLWGVGFSGTLAHCVYMQLFTSFQIIELQLGDNSFICAILQKSLVYHFHKLEWRFGIYELFDDSMCSYSERVFC